MKGLHHGRNYPLENVCFELQYVYFWLIYSGYLDNFNLQFVMTPLDTLNTLFSLFNKRYSRCMVQKEGGLGLENTGLFRPVYVNL